LERSIAEAGIRDKGETFPDGWSWHRRLIQVIKRREENINFNNNMLEPAEISIKKRFDPLAHAIVHQGDCLDFLSQVPDGHFKLIITSPPYNIGKEYENKLDLDRYIEQQKAVIGECVKKLSDDGSMCWQVGNYVDNGSIIPLDTILYPIFTSLGLKLKNRVVWHFEHGLHCSKRLSGRYETVNWFTKSDKYTFNLDPIRTPQKYPGKKYFKGPKAGQYSCNPLGKNPGDVWTIPNVKSNHVEKTIHPCQFPVELIERFVLSLTDPGDAVFDPFLGVGTSIVASMRHGRKGAGAEIKQEYVEVAIDRIKREFNGTLKTRPMDKPVFDPKDAGKSLTTSPWEKKNISQINLFTNKK
jgi:adenine-specific DNA-methyltransferase